MLESLQGFLANSLGVHVSLLITLSYKGVHLGAETHKLSDGVFASLTLEDTDIIVSFIAFLLYPVAIVCVELINVSPESLVLISSMRLSVSVISSTTFSLFQNGITWS